MTTRWHCKVCRSWGVGGPDVAAKHLRQHREPDQGGGAMVAFGFTSMPKWPPNARRRQVLPAWASAEDES